MFKNTLLMLSFLLVFSTVMGQKRIDAIQFRGVKNLDEGFTKKRLYSTEGSLVDAVKIEKDLMLLHRLAVVAKADYVLEEASENTVVLVFTIVENSTLIPDVNFWTVGGKLSGKVGLYQHNFLNRNILLGGFYQYNGKHSYGATVKHPYLFTAKMGLQATFLSWTSDEPLYFGEHSASYEYKNKSVELLGLYQKDQSNSFALGLNFFNEKYQYLNGADAVLEKPLSLDVNKYMLKFNYEFSNVRYDYFLQNGIANSLYIQSVVANKSTSQDAFYIFWNDFKYFKTLNDKLNLAFRFRAGLATNKKSPFSPFVLDNHENIRGVGDRIDRGSGTLVLNSECRYTVFNTSKYSVQGVGFVDFGAWRKPGGSLKDFTETDNMKLYPGLGLRFIHKRIFNAVFRIDYGIGISKNASRGLVFGIGQYF
ncbi:MAG: outer membrane protein assembly factor [Flavobacteriaceae bacterium]|nr:MAG: outer membrane protein assembly factor [Flavobacteriaceae bacterium]